MGGGGAKIGDKTTSRTGGRRGTRGAGDYCTFLVTFGTRNKPSTQHIKAQS